MSPVRDNQTMNNSYSKLALIINRQELFGRLGYGRPVRKLTNMIKLLNYSIKDYYRLRSVDARFNFLNGTTCL